MHLKFGVGLLFLVASLPAITQKEDREVKKHIEAGDKYLYELNAIGKALIEYEKAVSLDPENVEANYKAGIAQIEAIEKSKSLQYFLKAYNLEKDYRRDLTYFLGRAYQYNMEFDKAIKLFNLYRSSLTDEKINDQEINISKDQVDRRIYECKNAIEFISNPRLLQVKNLGDQINSQYGDYAPVINEGENILIFTSRREEGNLNPGKDENNLPYEEIYISQKQGNNWGKAMNIGPSVNTDYHDSSLGLSPDGQTLFVYKDSNAGDFYKSEYQSDGIWSSPVIVNSLNSAYAEKSITFSPDNKYVIFSSNRPGGYGGYDLYVSQRNSKGFTTPKNLGPAINSMFDEDSPFINYDGKSLFFSSKGWKGMGGFDIFKSTMDSTKGQWSEPVNLGYPVNTTDDDVHFVSSKDGKRAYYASVRDGGYGYADIYLMTSLQGTFTEPIEEIRAPIEKQKDTVSTTKLESENGFDIKISNIYFEFDQSKLKDQYIPELKKLKEVMLTDPSYRLLISGYTDNVGLSVYNIALSEQRAMNVAEFLIAEGVGRERLEIYGFGADRPLASNDYDKGGRELNRRVEFKLKK